MARRVFTVSQERTPAPSVASIMAEVSMAFPPADGRALAVALMAVAPMAAVDDIDDSASGTCRRFKNGEEHYAAKNFDFR
jgi:hypothetical protein